MGHGRAFESGASKRRRQREQRQKDDENVRKSHKLDQFFVRQSSQQSRSNALDSQESQAVPASSSSEEHPSAIVDPTLATKGDDNAVRPESTSDVDIASDFGLDVADRAY